MIRSTAVLQINHFLSRLLCILDLIQEEAEVKASDPLLSVLKWLSGPVSSRPLVKWQEHSGQEWSRAALCNVHRIVILATCKMHSPPPPTISTTITCTRLGSSQTRRHSEAAVSPPEGPTCQS